MSTEQVPVPVFVRKIKLNKKCMLYVTLVEGAGLL